MAVEVAVISFEQFLLEKRNEYNSNNVIVVDIQPMYANAIHFNIREFVNFLVGALKSGKNVLYYFNGPQTVGEDTQQEIVHWLMEQWWGEDNYVGDDEEMEQNYRDAYNALSKCQFCDKGYAYIRDYMDEGVDDGVLIQVIRYMYLNKITSSDDIPKEVKEQWELPQENIYIAPFAIDQLKRFNGAYMVGGGSNECLKEVCLIANAFNIKYTLMRKFIFG